MPEKGWRALSDDAQRATIWLTLGAAIVTALGGGAVFTYWGYVHRNPPDVLALEALAVLVLLFVAFYFFVTIGHHYFNVPKYHPFFPRPNTQAAAPTGTNQESTTQAPSIVVEPYGGNDATLVVRNSGGTARFVAEGQFIPAHCQVAITRLRPFRLIWQQPTGKTDFDNVGAGHYGTVLLMEVTYGTARTSAHVAVWGDGGGVGAWDRPMRGLVGVDPPQSYEDLGVLRIRVSIGAEPPLAETWTREYDMNWNGRTTQFHVREVAQ